MKNQIIKIVFGLFIVFCFFSTAYADTAIHLKISTPISIIYDQNITVTPCDSDNDGTTPAIATPYCAILQLQPGIQSSWGWDSTYDAYYLNSLDNISGSTTKDNLGNDVYNYWDWSLNGTEATTGLSEYALQSGDIISLNFIDPGHTLSSTPSGGGPLVTSMPPVAAPATTAKPTFDTKKASDFLVAQQKNDGSFGDDLYTDWTAIALASENNQAQVLKTIKYFEQSNVNSANLTDYERHAMALMALGLNPYNTNGENYIEKITNAFDGKQFGDPNEDNDDIFALIVLQNAGYTQNDKMINDDIYSILSAQNENGSWDNSPDMTGAAMESLATFNQNADVKNALIKAENFLKQNQKDDASWNENASSTAWALEGILAMNEKPADWPKYQNTPLDYLATLQDSDGGIQDADTQTKIWETSYIVSVLSGKTWNQIMQNFQKPVVPVLAIAPQEPVEPTIPQITATINTATIKTVAIEKIKPKLDNTVSVINALTNPATTTTTQAPQESWLKKLLNKIFGIF
ncbi:MAG: prenyltransferase/squalene oxidase repeat-containing protein [Minisyncoccia bacterium]